MKAAIGDVFSIPVSLDDASIGQVVETSNRGRMIWVAVFSPPIRNADLRGGIATILETDPVILANTFAVLLETGRWTALGRTEVKARIPWPAFKVAVAPGEFHVADHTGNVRRLATPEEVAALPFASVVAPIRVERATAALAGIGEWHDEFGSLRPSRWTEEALLGPR